jgi:hypothetical protein
MRATLVLVAFALLVGFAADVRAEGSDNDFSFVNATGYSIDKLFVSAADKESWEEDILGKETLPDGEAVNIKFSPKEGSDKYDIKVVYTDETIAIWQDIDLTKVNKFTAHYDRKADKTSAEIE